MYVLAIDTSTPQVTAGIVEVTGDSIAPVATRTFLDGRAHNEVLVTLILECLAESSLSRRDLAAVVTGCGPGPFTGLRVGMATAASFADALAIPVHGVCSLDALAPIDGPAVVVTDARRREVYAATYCDGHRSAGPMVLAPAALAEEYPQAERIVGSTTHARLVAEHLDHEPSIAEALPTPEALVRVAVRDCAATGGLTEPGAALAPLYLRRPDAVAPKKKPVSPALQHRPEHGHD
ncbi:tRNA (adenosine(37)-N6)-threonylcarbamoyltransferase complex dimerization subunit type 1 TsaB [Corynebacterium sp. TAE3-ERU12]|uniref:tRNA (adenosine(37)-N6)-threonylcarbamoyltransferase complex dimerization subunit type 1 TsaB n=1 Tax=Corynebacterium sp. TAE3-ERU12 TaxID=2849491 RepID=UPI001C458565|nr:tRNA (adenosine(37)-N6)-threonylcarbamoyltransferase complex dimerization subunit type 1 TsaB [Corynebacterium sp. TAE3-ERU12]MBV7294720.1 tRNA (adenosine(37)-N6)-threonylcarbamoyltransferase complex dimerization subunit type 1 TsaB [Corynebacterium sp. TAE3-ERU12]